MFHVHPKCCMFSFIVATRIMFYKHLLTYSRRVLHVCLAHPLSWLGGFWWHNIYIYIYIYYYIIYICMCLFIYILTLFIIIWLKHAQRQDWVYLSYLLRIWIKRQNYGWLISVLEFKIWKFRTLERKKEIDTKPQTEHRKTRILISKKKNTRIFRE